MSLLSWLRDGKTSTNTTHSQVRIAMDPMSPDVDRNIIGQLRKVGLDLTQPYHVRYLFNAPDDGAAHQLSDLLKSRGLTPDISKEQGKWRVTAGEDVVISESTMGERRSDFTSLVGNLGGKYLGWELKAKQTTKTTFTSKQPASS